jgi:hypothetical protein
MGLTAMDLVAIETPAAGVALAGKAAKLGDALVGIVASGELLQIVADELVEALAEGVRALAGAVDELLVD